MSKAIRARLIACLLIQLFLLACGVTAVDGGLLLQAVKASMLIFNPLIAFVLLRRWKGLTRGDHYLITWGFIPITAIVYLILANK